MSTEKRDAWLRRKKRVRRHIHGTAERPRLTVYRSLRHFSAQVIDDRGNRVLAAATTMGKGLQGASESTNKTQQATGLGKAIAQRCRECGIEAVVFDRNGYRYHGRVRAFVAAAREGGLTF